MRERRPPQSLLNCVQGEILDARIAYPNVLHIEGRDQQGNLWRLATQDAHWTPREVRALIGCSIRRADVDATSGELRCSLSDGSVLSIKPNATPDDPPYWELIGPNVVVECRPGVCWQTARSC